MNIATIVFDLDGHGRCFYTELIDLAVLGTLEIQRVSHIEWNRSAQSWDVIDPQGHLLHSAPSRAQCISWEQNYFNQTTELS